MSSNGQALEVVAAGNTVIEAKTFTARATRLSYAQAKQRLVLEGDGRTNAELWRQTRVGGPSSHAAARKILYWHGTNQIEVEDAQVFDFTEQLGAGGPLPRFIDPRTRTATRPR